MPDNKNLFLSSEKQLKEEVLKSIHVFREENGETPLYFRLHTYPGRLLTRVIITFNDRGYHEGLKREIPGVPLPFVSHIFEIPNEALKEFRDKWRGDEEEDDYSFDSNRFTYILKYFEDDAK